MKALKRITDPHAFQLLADETRRKIVYLLRVREMNVRQLTEQLGLTPQAVYHHVKKLLKGGLIEVTREERCGHLIESYYRATAEMFSFCHGTATAKSLRSRQLATEQMTTALQVLKELGFKLEYDENKIAELVDAQIALQGLDQNTSELETSIYEMDALDLLAKKDVVHLAKTLTMSDEEFDQDQGKRRKFRELLLSLQRK